MTEEEFDYIEYEDDAKTLAEKIGQNIAYTFTIVGFIIMSPLSIVLSDTAIFAAIVGFIVAMYVTEAIGKKIGFIVLITERSSTFRCIGMAALVLFSALLTSGLILDIFGDHSGVLQGNTFAIPMVGMIIGTIPVIILGTIYSFVLDRQKKQFNYSRQKEEINP